MKNYTDSDIENIVAGAFKQQVSAETENAMKQELQKFRKKLHTHPHITFLEACSEAQEKTAAQNVERREHTQRFGFWAWASLAASVCIIAAASIYISTAYFGKDPSSSGIVVKVPTVSNDTVVVDTEVQPDMERIEEAVVSNRFIVFKGTVVEHDSREPMSGVSVVCDGIEGETGEEGNFEIEIPFKTNLPGQLVVTRESYASVKTDIDLAYWADRSCVIPMYPPAAMEGYVRDEKGEIVTGVYVTMGRVKEIPENEIAIKQFVSDGPTDEYGFYRIAALAATGRQRYSLTVKSPGNEYMITSSSMLELLPLSYANHTNDIVIKKKNIINLRVTDANNNPLKEFRVNVQYPGRGRHKTFTVMTQKWCTFTINDFVDASYQRQIYHTNFASEITLYVDSSDLFCKSGRTNIPIFGGEVLYYEMKLEPAPKCIAAGVLLDRKGYPIESAKAYQKGNDYKYTKYTDNKGRFNIYGYDTQEQVDITFSCSFLDYTTNIICGDTNLIIRVPHTNKMIIGNVIAGSPPKAYEDISVVCLSLLNNKIIYLDYGGSYGKFWIRTINDNPNTKYKLFIKIPKTEYAPIIIPVSYSNKITNDIGTIVINKPASKLIVYLKDENGKSVRGTVYLYFEEWSNEECYIWANDKDHTGEFIFEQLPAGKYKMNVSYYIDNKWGKETKQIELKAGETKILPDIIISNE